MNSSSRPTGCGYTGLRDITIISATNVPRAQQAKRYGDSGARAGSRIISGGSTGIRSHG